MTLVEAIAEMMRRECVLIGVDFDGTLAPLVEHPDDAVPDSRAISLLKALAEEERLTVAVVSGRALSDLKARVGELPGAVLVGEHGNDTGEPVTVDVDLVAARSLIHGIRNEVGPVTVEEKPRSVTIHTRGLDASVASAVRQRIEAFVAGHHGLSLLTGKQVLEVTTASRTKGDAIADLATGCDGVIYLGDDTTDETVFARLGPDDIGIKVGEGDTDARFRVDDVPAVVDVIEQMARSL